MLTTLEKRWPLISLVLLLALLASLFLWPAARSPLTTTLLIIALGMALFFVVHRQVQAYREGKASRGRLVRNLAVEVGGILLSMALAMFLSRLVVTYVGAYLSGLWGLVLGLLAALVIGALAGMLVQRTWGRLLAK
jgi:uncharacterized membrane-anchored protein